MNRLRHLTDELLIGYIDGTLEAGVVDQMEDHLLRCPHCKTRAGSYSRLQTAFAAPKTHPARPILDSAIATALDLKGEGRGHSTAKRRAGLSGGYNPVSLLPTRSGLRWRGALGLSMAALLGGFTGLWLAALKSPKADVSAVKEPPKPVTSPNARINDSLYTCKVYLSEEEEKLSAAHELKRQRQLRAIFPRGWDGSRSLRVWPAASPDALDNTPLDRLRWSADAQGVLLSSLLSGVFRHRPEVRQAYRKFLLQSRAGSRSPGPHLSLQQWIDRDPRSASRYGQNGYVLDPRLKRAFIFNFSARELTLDEFLKRAASASTGCLVMREGNYKYLRHPGIRVAKRNGIYHFIKGD